MSNGRLTVGDGVRVAFGFFLFYLMIAVAGALAWGVFLGLVAGNAHR